MKNLIENSPKFQSLQKELRVTTTLSLTGITNFVVNYEDPYMVDLFLNHCFKEKNLYQSTVNIDAVELQRGSPGSGYSTAALDTLIFGTFKKEEIPSDGMGIGNGIPSMILTDPQTGERLREPDGFVNRYEVLSRENDDKLLVIRNLDYAMDFCEQEPGHIDSKSLCILDKFRHPNIKRTCRLLLVTNTPLILPFKVRRVTLEPVDEYEAQFVIDGMVDKYKKNKYAICFSDSQLKQIKRKLCGHTYTEAADALAEATSRSKVIDIDKRIDASAVVRRLREKINRNLMEDAVGLTHLISKPWEDYITPESSNFTFDVKKIIRDFSEITRLKEEHKDSDQNDEDPLFFQRVESIQTRMPHVIILCGKGGVGKSAFPIHFAWLLDFDVWDFNVGSSHSKWVGEGAERMREALDRISKTTHVVVRIDEYDRAMGSTTASGSGMHSAHQQVESEFMNWLQNCQEDNLFVKNNLFIVMTTNHKENITGPMLRSGRADLVIDIDNFDSKSMMETFMSAPRRMKHRGISILGFDDETALQNAIGMLDIRILSDIAATKNFTVRDIDILLMEMAAHNYYHERNSNDGLPWNTESFAKVLQNSVGSAEGDDTCELRLGDRVVMSNQP